MPALLIISLLGCAPQDATVEGQWYTWLAANTSAAVIGDELPGVDESATIYECSGRGWDEGNQDFQDGYVGPRTEEDFAEVINNANDRYIGGDCPRNSAGSYEPWCEGAVDEMEAECNELRGGLDYHTFLNEDGYYALKGDVAAWRSEAMLNGEGDLQLTIHHDLGAGADFRFAFAIDPDFSPVICTSDDAGNPVIEYVDGASWLSQWSANDEGYTVYYLNAGAHQVDQSASGNAFWYLPTDWLAGFGYAKFAGDEFTANPASYGQFDENGDGDSFLVFNDEQRADPDMGDYADAAADLREEALAWEKEITELAGANDGSTGAFYHRIEDNMWRPVDSSKAGLDGWMELQSSWVRVANSSNIEEGGTVEGDYQILFSGFDSNSRLLVTGTFLIEDLKLDPWAYPVLEDELREEYDNPYCGGAEMPQ